MSALDRFLSAHGNMRKNGGGWRGNCPACGTSARSTALSVAEGTTGALLVKCFAGGCEPEAICAALGLAMTDLFPEALTAHHHPGPRRRGLLTAGEALRALKFEAELAAVAAGNLANGIVLSDGDRVRLATACNRIEVLYQEVQA